MPLAALENGLAAADIAAAASSVYRRVVTGDANAAGEPTLGWRAVAEHGISIYLASEDEEITAPVADLAAAFRGVYVSVAGGEDAAFAGLPALEQQAWIAVARIVVWATQTHSPRDLDNGVGYFAASAEDRLQEKGIVRQ